jgi:hypothetical protein
MSKIFRLSFFILFLTNALMAQDQSSAPAEESDLKDYNALLIAPAFTASYTLGPLGERFGFMGNVGLNLGYNFRRNWQIGVEGCFLFTNQVKEVNLLNSIATSTGSFISLNGELVTVKLQGRGYIGRFFFGKTIPIKKEKPGNGIMLQSSLGVVAHQILINVREDVLPQLNKTYRKGYDRLGVGPVFSQFIGYTMLEKKKFFNFYAGFQAEIFLSRGMRPVDFDTGRKNNVWILGFLPGFKIGYYIPVFLNTGKNDFYY